MFKIFVNIFDRVFLYMNSFDFTSPFKIRTKVDHKNVSKVCHKVRIENKFKNHKNK